MQFFFIILLQFFNHLNYFQMKITVTDGNQVHTFDVDDNEEVQNIKALVEVQIGIPIDRQQLLFNGLPLKNQDRLNQKGVKENDLLFVNLVAPKPKPQQGGTGGMSIADMIKNFDKSKKEGGDFRMMFPEKNVQMFMDEAERIFLELKDDHFRLSQLSESQPEVAKLIMDKDVKGIAKFLQRKDEERAKQIFEERKKFQQLSKDPMNPEFQKMVQERIHRENIDKNRQFAQEYIPEVFGHINMLYINATINKVPIQAFVDSGAQSTIMSQSLAQRCGLMRLVDKRHAGVAQGVGTCKIIGRIHAADIEIEKKFITCAFTVIQNNAVEFLLGLDMLKRFSCLIDLKKNELNFNDGMIVTKFLGDGEIKKNKMAPKKEDLEEKVKKITSMGFSKDEAIRALKSCNYNQEVASNMLMQQKYGK